MQITMDTKNLLILSQVKGLGPAFFKKHRIELLNSNNIQFFIDKFTNESKSNFLFYEENAEKIIEDCKSLGIQMISCLSNNYPQQLLDINLPPVMLYIKGNTTLLKNIVSIIGTRNSTPLGNLIAERLGSYFSKDFAICNGLVEGIDEHSIHFGDKTISNAIGVISGGLNYEFTCSKPHAKLIDRVLDAGGLVLSEFSPQQCEDKYSGSKASRIQAGLSQGLILVQSGIDGGSKYTLSTFAKLPRTLGVIHYPSSKEYQSKAFEANRVIVNEQYVGLARIIGLKTEKTISVKSIITISGKKDYDLFKNAIIKNNKLEFFNSME